MTARIQKAETQIVSVPLTRPVENHPYLGRRSSSNFVLLRLLTDDGLSGFGLAHTSTVGKARVLQTLLDEMHPLLIGKGALDHEQIYRAVSTFFTDLGKTGATLQALAAVDIALWDLKGKALAQPLFRLLGGHRESVPCYASGGLRRQLTVDELVADSMGFVNRGFRAMKLRLGGRPFREDIERVRAVREAIGADIDLMVDFNWSFTPPDAIRIGRLLEPFDLFWIEDPVPADDLDGLAEVSRALDTRVTFGETLERPDQYKMCLEQRAADCYMADVQKVGGITAWMRIAAIVGAWHRPLASHVEPEVHVHLVAAAPNGLTVEYTPNHDVLYTHPFRFEKGQMILPAGPGLGVELNEEMIGRYLVSS